MKLIYNTDQPLHGNRLVEIKSNNLNNKAFAFLLLNQSGHIFIGIEQANGYNTAWACPMDNSEGFVLDLPVPKYVYPLIRKAIKLRGEMQ